MAYTADCTVLVYFLLRICQTSPEWTRSATYRFTANHASSLCHRVVDIPKYLLQYQVVQGCGYNIVLFVCYLITSVSIAQMVECLLYMQEVP
jgi:hypothetical protein